MGWHEQGDGKWFLGINVEQGRVKDFNGVNVKSALKKIVEDHQLTMILSPTQSIIFRDIDPADKAIIDAKLKEHGILPIEEVDPLVRTSMACPAFPLCGLAIAEAERRMPDWMSMMRQTMNDLNLGEDHIMMRMTGCPNGCARPYMAELALVGDGPDMYQIWVGGSRSLTNVGEVFANKVKYSDMKSTLEPLLVYWRDHRKEGEGFGEFCLREGVGKLESFSNGYKSALRAQLSK